MSTPAAADTATANVEAQPTSARSARTNDSTDHRLMSLRVGESEIEQLAHRVETRRDERIPVTSKVQNRLLRTCRKIAKSKGYHSLSRIHLTDLVEFHKTVDQEVDDQTLLQKGVVLNRLGFYNPLQRLLEVLERALHVVNEVQATDDDWFDYQDFSFYYTRLESSYPWMRNGTYLACLVIFFFYFFTPVLFCAIMEDRGVCPDDPTDQNRSYYGWLSALYFASTTMSTVGYGDLSVDKGYRFNVFMGAAYMIVAMLVAIMAFSAAAESAFAPLSGFQKRVLDRIIIRFGGGGQQKDLLLHQQIRRIKFVKLTQITLQFAGLNLLGIFVSRYFANHTDDPDEQWRWMDSFYWAIQTTTTIGYGDFDMAFGLRWFQIFYLTLSTFLVGSALGKLAGLKQELEDTRRYYAWQRREVSKGMIEEMQAYDHDDKVDQYEFVVASLLVLNKISSSDVKPIMDKYRELAGEKGFIQISNLPESSHAVDEGGRGEEDEELEKKVEDMQEIAE